jgi:hypothetical protein
VEAVLFTVVHVNHVHLVVGLERRLIRSDAFVDPLIVTRVLLQERR